MYMLPSLPYVFVHSLWLNDCLGTEEKFSRYIVNQSSELVTAASNLSPKFILT